MGVGGAGGAPLCKGLSVTLHEGGQVTLRQRLLKRESKEGTLRD